MSEGASTVESWKARSRCSTGALRRRSQREVTADEQSFITHILSFDAKNYHVWSYRQWLVQRFGLWGSAEMEAIEQMLKTDVRNNSAWNHRWFLVFAKDQEAAAKNEEIMKREME